MFIIIVAPLNDFLGRVLNHEESQFMIKKQTWLK
jgi:hypothetical protein